MTILKHFPMDAKQIGITLKNIKINIKYLK